MFTYLFSVLSRPDVATAIVFFWALVLAMSLVFRLVALTCDDVKVNGESPRISPWRTYICAGLWAWFLYLRL